MASGPIKAASQASGSEKDGASSVGDGQSSMGASSEVWGCAAGLPGYVAGLHMQQCRAAARRDWLRALFGLGSASGLHITAIAAVLQPAHLLSTHPPTAGRRGLG